MLTDLDEALERLQESDFEYGDGSVNEGPMAVVALEALGHPSLIPFFTDVYAPRLRPRAEGAPIARAERTRALGDRARRADWLATFEVELAEAGREAVLAEWLPKLLPGAFAAAGSGLLRTTAALRALEDAHDAVRRRELAFGLAHWASRYQVLPGEPGTRPEPGRRITTALDRLTELASDRRRTGPMSEAVLVLEGDAGFAAEVAAIDLHASPLRDAIVDLARRVASLQLAHPESRGAYGQVIKVALGLLVLADHLPEELRTDTVGRAAQIALAVHGVYGTGVSEADDGVAGDPERDALAKDVDEIRYRAACSGQESAITLTEACLRAHGMDADRLWLRAAADAALRFESAHGGRGG